MTSSISVAGIFNPIPVTILTLSTSIVGFISSTPSIILRGGEGEGLGEGLILGETEGEREADGETEG